jgi:hypothetical protein
MSMPSLLSDVGQLPYGLRVALAICLFAYSAVMFFIFMRAPRNL